MSIYKFIFFVVLALDINAREIVDMVGRKVEIPQSIEKVYPTAPPMALLTYIFSPQSIAVMPLYTTKLFSSKNGYFDEKVNSLPYVGGWHGGSRANLESILVHSPQVVIAWKNNFFMDGIEETFAKFKIPVVFVNEDSIDDEPRAILFVGTLMGQEKRAEELEKDAKERIDYVKKLALSVSENERAVVYYAGDSDGLSTECPDSFHFTPFMYIGIKPAFVCSQKQGIGNEKVTIEEVLKINPDVIITRDDAFFSTVFEDQKWLNIKAVKEKRVYLIPKDPINFLDRPPSFMRILGVEWLASVVYPSHFKKDIEQETISFYKKYLRVDIDKKQAREILKGKI